ncbi:hypothetical protein LUU34_01517500 [Aix galericulata]|nr:hypothetical protein LUU34_01517500 [Aix galericulata]
MGERIKMVPTCTGPASSRESRGTATSARPPAGAQLGAGGAGGLHVDARGAHPWALAGKEPAAWGAPEQRFLILACPLPFLTPPLPRTLPGLRGRLSPSLQHRTAQWPHPAPAWRAWAPLSRLAILGVGGGSVQEDVGGFRGRRHLWGILTACPFPSRGCQEEEMATQGKGSPAGKMSAVARSLELCSLLPWHRAVPVPWARRVDNSQHGSKRGWGSPGCPHGSWCPSRRRWGAGEGHGEAAEHLAAPRSKGQRIWGPCKTRERWWGPGCCPPGSRSSRRAGCWEGSRW